MKQPCTFDTGNGFESMTEAWQQSTDGIGTILHWRIDTNHRPRLGSSVTFEDAHPIRIGIDASRFIAQLLRTGEDIANAVQIVGMRGTRISRQEGIGAEHDRGVRVVDQFWNYSVVQGRRVVESADT